MFKRLFRSIKYFFTKGKNRPTYRPGTVTTPQAEETLPPSSSRLRSFYPRASHREDMNLFYSPYKFKFDKDHFFIVHFTAGWRNRKFKDFAKRFLEMGLNTFYLDESGTVWQQAHGDRCGHHTGSSAKWKGEKVSKKCAGVEVTSGGKLKDNKTWFNQEIPATDRRTVRTGEGYRVPGTYQIHTEAQEEELAKLLAWVIEQGLPPENILGHDDIRIGGKNDPGGALSLPLKTFIAVKVLPLVSR